MLALIVFILILGVLVLVHEAGHFLVARRNGITAHEFGFGFPPRVFGAYKDSKGNWKWVWGRKDVKTKNTIYSLNWFPIGGFVKIKGEDGGSKEDKDSFAGKSAWVRIKVLLAGVVMNFVLAWICLSVGFMIGTYQEVEDGTGVGSKILINSVSPSSPAEQMGLQMGDELLGAKKAGVETKFQGVGQVQQFVAQNRGQDLVLEISRNGQLLEVQGMPRSEVVEGQGYLGIGLSQVEKVRFSFFEALWRGLIEMKNFFILMFWTFKQLLFGQASSVDVTGIVGIAVYTGQVVSLGIVQILRFAAVLSLNLGIINALPFPALDGGRVLFVLIEKLKGSPVSEKIEQGFHAAGFAFLMILMVVVTFKDFARFDILDKIKGVF